MINKLHNKYLTLKFNNSSYSYLFQSEKSYFFFAYDATRLAPMLGLEITTFNNSFSKCEFLIKDSKDYFEKLSDLKIKFQIVKLTDDIYNYDFEQCINSSNFTQTMENFLNINLDILSISQSIDLLYHLQNQFSNFQEKE